MAASKSSKMCGEKIQLWRKIRLKFGSKWQEMTLSWKLSLSNLVKSLFLYYIKGHLIYSNPTVDVNCILFIGHMIFFSPFYHLYCSILYLPAPDRTQWKDSINYLWITACSIKEWKIESAWCTSVCLFSWPRPLWDINKQTDMALGKTPHSSCRPVRCNWQVATR